MINLGKYSVLGTNVDAVDYEFAVEKIVNAAERKSACSVSALAAHGVMTGFMDRLHLRRLNGLDLVLPDGQSVRWALWWLFKKELPDRVYGPNLTLRVAQAFSERELSIYLYGSKPETISKLSQNLRRDFPNLKIAGMEPSKFRRLTDDERMQLVERIKASGANAVLLGLGCPRQEVWAYEYRNLLSIPILAVGAAFDFHAGTLSKTPKWMQDWALEWLYRTIQEPQRLWKRFIVLNSFFVINVTLQYLGLIEPIAIMPNGDEKIESYG